MAKKNIFIVILILLASIGFITYLLTRESDSKLDPVRAVPADALLIAKINQTDFLLQKPALFAVGISNVQPFYFLNEMVQLLDSLAAKPQWNAPLMKSQLAVSLHITGKTRLTPFIAIEFEKSLPSSELIEQLNHHFKYQATIQKHDYENNVIYTIQPIEKRKIGFSICFYKKNILLSSSPILIERSLRQLKTDLSLLSNSEFMALYSGSDKNVAGNLMISPGFWTKIGRLQGTNELRAFFPQLDKITQWSVFDLFKKDLSLLATGLIPLTSQPDNLFQLLASQKSQPFNAQRILPASTRFFISLRISDISAYYADFENFMTRNNTIGPYRKQLQRIDTVFMTSSRKFLTDFGVKEMILAEVPTDSGKLYRYTLFEVSDTAAVINTFEKMLETQRMRNHQSGTLKSTLNIGNNQIRHFRFPVANLPGILGGQLFALEKGNQVAISGMYVIFADDTESLSYLLYQLQNDPLLETDADYLFNTRSLESKGNLRAYWNDAEERSMPEMLIKSMPLRKTPPLSSRSVVSLQLSTEKQLLYSSLSITPKKAADKTVRYEWDLKTDTNLVAGPFMVKNHINSSQEIIVQDALTQLYLIDNNGLQLWKKTLKEPVIGNIVQVDRFANKKLQLLFCTRSYLWMIDRNGKIVEGYPVKLESGTKAGVSVITDRGESRIIVPLSNGSMWVGTLNGTPIKNNVFFKTENTVRTPVQIICNTNTCNLVTQDKKQVYVSDISGKIIAKYRLQDDICGIANLAYSSTDTSSFEIIAGTKNGKVALINKNNQPKYSRVSKSTIHTFSYEPASGNEKAVLSFTSGAEWTVTDLENHELFRTRFSHSPVQTVNRMVLTSGIAGWFILSGNELYITDQRYRQLSGTPIACTRFMVDLEHKNKNNSWRLIICNDNFVSCVLINR